jgi:hypothetical protein
MAVQTALGINLDLTSVSALSSVADHLLHLNLIQVGFRLLAYSRGLFSRGRLRDNRDGIEDPSSALALS